METNTPNIDSIQENSTPTTESKKSLILPLSLLLVFLIIGGGYYYLNTLYPTLFKDTVKRTYQAIIPSSKEENTDINTDGNTDSNIDINANLPKSNALPSPSPTPRHSPYPLIPDSGTAGTFKVNHSSNGGPTITNIKIDPLNARLGDTVTITLNLTHPTEIKEVNGFVKTDTKPLNFTFTKKERQNTNEVWNGQLTLTEPFLYTYIYSFNSSDGQKSSTLDMGLRSE